MLAQFYLKKKKSQPSLVIDDILVVLGKSKAFHYFRFKERLPFCVRGLYDYNVLPFGLTNDPSTLQQFMSVVLHEKGNFGMADLGDIIILSPILKEYTKHIQNVFFRHDLNKQLPKCKFIQY